MSNFVTNEKLIKRKWSNDIFVSNDELTLTLEEEGIEGDAEFEEKTEMSREVLWHIKNGKLRYSPFDKADYILTKMGSVDRVHQLTVYSREKDGEGNFRYTPEGD